MISLERIRCADGSSWDFDHATLAYRRTVRWSDGRTTEQGFLERPQQLIENGIPAHLFCATAEGPGDGLKDATRQPSPHRGKPWGWAENCGGAISWCGWMNAASIAAFAPPALTIATRTRKRQG